MTLEDLDRLNLFSITAWKSADGWTVCTQRYAGDAVKQITRATLSEALVLALPANQLPPPPYGAQ